MSAKPILEAQLEAAFHASSFHSLMGSLKGITEDEARWVPPRYKSFPHQKGSVLSLAFHTAGDKFVLMSHAFGDGQFGWPQVQNRFESLGGGLSAALALANEGHSLVLTCLREWPEERLEEQRPYYGGKSFAARRIFEIVAEHDLYHSGQIRYVRCLIAGGAPSAPR